MTGEQEPMSRENERAVDGRDWLIAGENGGHVIITDSLFVCLFVYVGGMEYGWGLDAPARPSATIL